MVRAVAESDWAAELTRIAEDAAPEQLSGDLNEMKLRTWESSLTAPAGRPGHSRPRRLSLAMTAASDSGMALASGGAIYGQVIEAVVIVGLVAVIANVIVW